MSVVPSVHRTVITRLFQMGVHPPGCYQWKPAVRPLPPHNVSAQFYGYLKLQLHRSEKVGTDVGVTENRTGDLQHRKQRTYQLSAPEVNILDIWEHDR